MVGVRRPPSSRRPIATSESTRARRFALPDLKDERTGESIEAFLNGRAAKGLALRGQASQSADAVALRAMPGRQEFNAALERESARAARYDRPAAVYQAFLMLAAIIVCLRQAILG
jgi:hypothetical protein